MSAINCVQVVPDSQRYTNIDQLIVTMEALAWREQHKVLALTSMADEIRYILVGLKNTKADGLDLREQPLA